MHKTFKHRFWIFVTTLLVLYNTYDLFRVESTGNYINKFRYCFLLVLLLSWVKFKTIQKKGDFVFSGLSSLLRYIGAILLIVDGYMRFSRYSGAMHDFGIRTLVIGAVVFLIQRKISRTRIYYVEVQK